MRRVKELSLVVIILAVIVGACWAIDGFAPYDKQGARVDPGQIHTAKNTWVVIDATASGVTPTDLAVTERTYTTVVTAIATAASNDEEISIYGDEAAEIIVISSWNAVRFRCIGATNNGTVTYQIYAGTLGVGGTDCEIAKVGQLAFVIGTQVSTTSDYELADTVTVTTADWPKSWSYASPGDTSEQVAEASIDLMGADLLVLLATTANTDCKLLGKGY